MADVPPMRLIAALFFFAFAAPAQAQTVHDAIDDYARFQGDISALLDDPIESAGQLDTALERVARHDVARLTRGWIAYGALTAAQSPAFASGIRARVRAAGRAPVLRQLRRDASYARRRPQGSAEAIQLILRASAADSTRIIAAGHRFEGIGTALDTGAWTLSERSTRETRLRRASNEPLPAVTAARLHIGALSATPLNDPTSFGGARFWDTLAQRAGPPTPTLPWRERSSATPLTDRMLTIAALIVVEAESSERTRVDAMLDEPRMRECFELQQLQFRQCASVAHDPNEDALCLARHGLIAPASCFGAQAEAP